AHKFRVRIMIAVGCNVEIVSPVIDKFSRRMISPFAQMFPEQFDVGVTGAFGVLFDTLYALDDPQPTAEEDAKLVDQVVIDLIVTTIIKTCAPIAHRKIDFAIQIADTLDTSCAFRVHLNKNCRTNMKAHEQSDQQH
ncbi:MAG: hypothetical protein ACYSUH_06495, partial [Planctomycetota bacterium]